MLLARRRRRRPRHTRRRIDRVIAELAPDRAVRYLGSILLRDDEVVLCQFEGPAGSVRDVAELAEVPFERILATASSTLAALTDGRCEFVGTSPFSTARIQSYRRQTAQHLTSRGETPCTRAQQS